MITWPDKLVFSLALKQTILFLGSGVSHNSVNANGEHPKTWRAFLEAGAGSNALDNKQKKIIKANLKSENYLMACELLKRYLPDNEFNDLLDDSFRAPRFQTAEIHKEIFKLDSRIVITPNFDSIYESYVQSETQGATLVKHYYDDDLVSVIRRRTPIILKIHGSISTPNKMIFTQVDYAKARSQHSNFYQLLNALLLTQTFLFLGAGLNDPDIKLLLENNAFQYSTTQSHYFVIPKNQVSEKELEIYSQSLGLTFIQYNPANNHQELTDSLRQLNILVDAERLKIAANQSW